MSDNVFSLKIDGVAAGSQIMKALEKINSGIYNRFSILDVECAIIHAQATANYCNYSIDNHGSNGLSGFLQRRAVSYDIELSLIEINKPQSSDN